jgi:peptidoglycan/xylan/chitin deacetylase (PgdA/CDA1 family)
VVKPDYSYPVRLARRAAALLSLAALPSLALAAPHKSHRHRREAAPVAARSGASASRPPQLPSAPPEILFTFDDGPSLERTPRILDTLDKHHIKAVYFVLGMHLQGDSPTAERSRAMLREIVARGHAVGNHTIHHLFLCGKRGPKVAADEIEQNARLIEQAIGQRPELYRTPYGAHCKSLSETLAHLGVTHTAWDIDPQDWKVQNTAKVRDYVISHLRRARGRNIVLMHDIHQCTVEALPQILDWLEQENAARVARGEPAIRVIDYAYLLPPRPLVPPILDSLGRVLVEQVGASRPLRWLQVLAARALPAGG